VSTLDINFFFLLLDPLPLLRAAWTYASTKVVPPCHVRWLPMFVVKFLQWTQMFAQLSFFKHCRHLRYPSLFYLLMMYHFRIGFVEQRMPNLSSFIRHSLSLRLERTVRKTYELHFFLVMVISDGDGSQRIFNHENIFVWTRLVSHGWSSGVTSLTIAVVVHEVSSAIAKWPNAPFSFSCPVIGSM